MPNTQNKSFTKYTPKQKRVLDLEKKYFNILFKVFSQKSFSHSLNQIMIEINSSWQRIHDIWGKANVVDLAVERLINYKTIPIKQLDNKFIESLKLFFLKKK